MKYYNKIEGIELITGFETSVRHQKLRSSKGRMRSVLPTLNYSDVVRFIKWMLIGIKDNGKGISEEDVPLALLMGSISLISLVNLLRLFLVSR